MGGCKSCCWDPLKGFIDAVLENKLVKDVRLLVTLFMAVTSYVAVGKELRQRFLDPHLDLSFAPPDDRCVPYFDRAEQLVEGQEPNSILYSYVDGEPQVGEGVGETPRLCVLQPISVCGDSRGPGCLGVGCQWPACAPSSAPPLPSVPLRTLHSPPPLLPPLHLVHGLRAGAALHKPHGG